MKWLISYVLISCPLIFGKINDAYRRLANRWLAIAWKLWQTRQPYDEAFHLQQRLLRAKPQP